MLRLKHLLEFDYPNRSEENLVKLNRMLAKMKLKNLELKCGKTEDFWGYIVTTTDAQGRLLGHRFGLDSGTLICTPSPQGGCFQIDVVATPLDGDLGQMEDRWCEDHPDREFWSRVTYQYARAYGSVIIYRRKDEFKDGNRQKSPHFGD